MRELQQPGASRKLPLVVADVVDRVRDLYEAARGYGRLRIMEDLRKTMTMAAHRGTTEDDVFAAWREVLVREVQES